MTKKSLREDVVGMINKNKTSKPQIENNHQEINTPSCLNFDTSSMVNPKNPSDISAAIDEAFSEVRSINKILSNLLKGS